MCFQPRTRFTLTRIETRQTVPRASRTGRNWKKLAHWTLNVVEPVTAPEFGVPIALMYTQRPLRWQRRLYDYTPYYMSAGTTCVRVIYICCDASGVRQFRRRQNEISRNARKEWLSHPPGAFSSPLPPFYLSLPLTLFVRVCVSAVLRLWSSRTWAPTRERPRYGSTHLPTMRLSTSADEVQGPLDRDFSSSTAEYVVIGFCGDTPDSRPSPRTAADRFQYQLIRGANVARTATVTGNPDAH